MFKRNDYIVGIASILLGIFILLQSAELIARVKMSIDPAGPAALPNLMAYIMIAIGIIHLVGAWHANRVIEEKQSKSVKEFVEQYKAVVYVTLVSIIYAVFLESIGYLILTPLLIGSLLWIVKMRNFGKISQVSIFMTIILFTIFKFGLKVKLPLGIINYFLGY
ncbi:MAG: hypothetical protein JM58_04565 [Peptococcaceae bacterium BICA1-8]|nr:MAG: hypothetical protein JM58_04565 [Peptococcaceae bacterium BICA1-8]